MSKKIGPDLLWTIAAWVAVAIGLWGINLPFVGLYNANNNYLALAAKNFLRYGIIPLHFLPTYAVSRTIPNPVPYYLHHPVLFFLVGLVPIALFGSASWAVHLGPFLSVVASLVVYYYLVSEIANREVARWATVFAALFPLLSFFWKMVFFEQASLLFTLMVLYFSVRYWKTGRRRFLLYVGAAAFLGGATDWYGGYLVFGFLYLLVARTGRRIWPAFFSYLFGEALGLGTYVAALFYTGNLGAVWDGYAARGLASELTSLSYWPVRLGIITLVRIFLYASPIVYIALYAWIRKYLREPRTTLLHAVGAVFLIIGSVSLVALPTTVWGHSYFLYYLVPFLALVSGVWFARRMKRSVGIAAGILVFQLIWSIGISGLKVMQVAKQSWKYDFGKDVSHIVPAFHTVGVVEYPGDVLENSFDLATRPMSPMQADAWAADPSGNIQYVLVTCRGTCTDGERSFIRRMETVVGVQEFHYEDRVGWLLNHAEEGKATPIETETPVPTGTSEQSVVSPVIRLYRVIRDVLGSTQI